MNTQNKNFLIISYLGQLLVIFIPLITIFYFGYLNQPDTDIVHYYMDTKEFGGFVQANILKYEFWSGRYTATFLMMLIPNLVGVFNTPFIVITSTSLLLFLLAYYLIRQISSTNNSLYLAGCFLIILILSAPRPIESYYWIASHITYFSGYILILALVIVNYKYLITKKRNITTLLLVSILSFLVAGTNEIIMIDFIIANLIILMFSLIKYKWDNKFLIFLYQIIFSIIGAVIVFASPGNLARASYVKESEPTGSIAYSFQEIIKTVIPTLIGSAYYQLGFISLLIFIIVYFNHIKNSKLRNQSIISLVLVLFLSVLNILISLYTIGEYPGRVEYITTFAYCLALLFFVSQIMKSKLSARYINYTIPIMVIIIITSYHSNILYSEYTQGTAIKYNEYSMGIHEDINQCISENKSECEIEKIPDDAHSVLTISIYGEDEYNNNAWERYYSLSSLDVKNTNN